MKNACESSYNCFVSLGSATANVKNARKSRLTCLDSICNANIKRKNVRNNRYKCIGFINSATTNMKNTCECRCICFGFFGSATANVKNACKSRLTCLGAKTKGKHSFSVHECRSSIWETIGRHHRWKFIPLVSKMVCSNGKQFCRRWILINEKTFHWLTPTQSA